MGIPEGWNSLDVVPEEAIPVDGLLSNGRVTEAEWWGPVPEELWSASGDGSGWAFDTGLIFDGAELIAWRPRP